MKKLLIILFLVALSVIAGWLWQKNQFLNENATIPTNIVESIKRKGFSLTAEEEAIVLKLAESGSNEDQIVSAITERRRVLANLEEDADIDNPFYDRSLGRLLTREEALIDAYSQGITTASELEKVAATYDLLVFGKTDIEIPEPAPQVISEDKPSFVVQPTPTTGTSFIDKWEQERKEKCQEEINKYNSCMNEYNAEMAEYNACLAEANRPKSQLGSGVLKLESYCYKPINFCSKPYCVGL